jgi:DNA-binding transcriptional ArsR family regulator
MPLFASDWSKEWFEIEFDAFEEYFDELSKVFGAMSNITRIKMLRKLRGKGLNNKLCRFYTRPRFESENCLGTFKKTRLYWIS